MFGRFLCPLMTLTRRPCDRQPRCFRRAGRPPAPPSRPHLSVTARNGFVSCWKTPQPAPIRSEQQQLRKSVVTEYLPVARSLAGRYSGRGVERADLEQLAFLGLVKAVRRWEPGRSEDFLQFAVPTIVGEIKRYFRDHSWLVRPPRRIQELRAAITEAEQTHRHRDGSGPTEAELAAATGVTPHDIGEARAAAACCRPRSLDEGQGVGLAMALGWGDEDPELRRVEDRVTVAAAAGHADRPGARGGAHAVRQRLVAVPDRFGARGQPDAGVPLVADDRRQAALLHRDVIRPRRGRRSPAARQPAIGGSTGPSGSGSSDVSAGSRPVLIRPPATSCSLMLCCWE